jgi:hypothetical protein
MAFMRTPGAARAASVFGSRQLPNGSKRSIPVTCRNTGDVLGVGLVKAIRRRLLLTAKEGVTDEEFYTRSG